MNNRYDKDNFEDFLQTESENFNSFPDSKVWNNIFNELHATESWRALTIVSLLIIIALCISTYIYDNPVKPNYTAALIGFNQQKNTSSTTSTQNNVFATNIFPSNYTKKQLNNLSSSSIVHVKSNVKQLTNLTTTTQQLNNLPSSYLIAANSINNFNNLHALNTNESESNFIENITEPFTTENNLPQETKKNIQLVGTQKLSNKIFSNQLLINSYNNYTTTPITVKRNSSKFELQVYATPSISFRRLVDDKSRILITSKDANTTSLPTQYYTNINDVVRHKPALGLEAGVGMLYKLNNKLKFRTGLQFNIRKYYIDSYKSGTSIAQIAIISNNGLDTINQLSTQSTTGSSLSSILKNSLYQISIPLGLQWQLLDGKKFGISLGASIQPTLTLNKNVYLISTDYKYYTDGNSFFRKWNFNTSLEINFTYKVGSYNIFVSPQVRYQHLPTYTDKYPIKEYRLDDGLRIGFTKEIF